MKERLKSNSFSVLIPVYFKEKSDYLRQSIDSILNQTILPDEILIVKDGKLTTELDNLVNEYMLDYPDLVNAIQLKENMGLGIALSIGVEKCKYDLIARMDSDDVARNDRFEMQINYFEANPEVDVVGSYITEFEDIIDCYKSVRAVPLTMEEITKGVKKRNPFNHMTVMFKKNSVISAGNYKHLPYFEDYFLWVRMLKSGCLFGNINKSLVLVRIGDGMYKRRSTLESIKSFYIVQKELKSFGHITAVEMVFNIAYRTIFVLMPPKLKQYIYRIYRFFLREDIDRGLVD